MDEIFIGFLIFCASLIGICFIHLIMMMLFDEDYLDRLWRFIKGVFGVFGELVKLICKAITKRTERFALFRIKHRNGNYSYRVKRSIFFGLPLCWGEHWDFDDFTKAKNFKEEKEQKRKEKYGNGIIREQKIKI